MAVRLLKSSAKWLLRITLVALIAAAHVRAIFVLYPTNHSDVVRFLLPTGVAFALYYVVLPQKHLVWPIVALALTFLSWWGGMAAAVNTYGS